MLGKNMYVYYVIFAIATLKTKKNFFFGGGN